MALLAKEKGEDFMWVFNCFPLTNLSMCWFHVEYNVGKHILRKRVPEFLVPTIKADIKMLHSTLSQEEYKFQLNVVKARWSSHSAKKIFKIIFGQNGSMVALKIGKFGIRHVPV